MWKSEWLATGKRKCTCDNIKLKIKKETFQRRIRRSKNIIIDTLYMMANKDKYATEIIWKAVCSECEKLYLICSSKKELMKHIEISKMKIMK